MGFCRTLFTLSFLVAGLNLLAWGQTGHRVIGKIAEDHLSRKARKEVRKLLGNESLAMASTWMDEVRADTAYDYARPWHYVNIPTGSTYETSDKNKDGDLVEAIQRMIATLQNEEAGKEEKTEALKMLVHLVGDLHQPLHIGTGEDRGGNRVRLRFFSNSSNLHRVWDSGMIKRKQLSYTELAQSIDHAPKDQVKKWLEGTVTDWAHEAMQYREQVYDFEGNKRLGYDYLYKNWNLVEQQLLKGGIRLAGLLNAIYG